MPGDYFWECVESLSAALDGDSKTANDNLNVYLSHCLQLSPEQRAKVRQQMIQIIGGLAQLEMRLSDANN